MSLLRDQWCRGWKEHALIDRKGRRKFFHICLILQDMSTFSKFIIFHVFSQKSNRNVGRWENVFRPYDEIESCTEWKVESSRTGNNSSRRTVKFWKSVMKFVKNDYYFQNDLPKFSKWSWPPVKFYRGCTSRWDPFEANPKWLLLSIFTAEILVFF